MKLDQQGRLEACGTNKAGETPEARPYRRHLGGYSRADILKSCARGGVLTGLVGLCAVLVSREEKFKCSSRCGRCPKLSNGICELGLR